MNLYFFSYLHKNVEIIPLWGGAQWSEIKNLVQILQSLQNFEFITLVHKQTFFVKKKFP
jgi:hypothetical protein